MKKNNGTNLITRCVVAALVTLFCGGAITPLVSASAGPHLVAAGQPGNTPWG
jgi:hypothetical protein